VFLRGIPLNSENSSHPSTLAREIKQKLVPHRSESEERLWKGNVA
jgi:hypothetical protein